MALPQEYVQRLRNGMMSLMILRTYMAGNIYLKSYRWSFTRFLLFFFLLLVFALTKELK
jgi:hypothetical protein